MIRSMTGFGRAEKSGAERRFTVEMKSVNHRYLDVSVRIPKEYAYLETAVRAELKKYLERGKVDVFVTCVATGEPACSLEVNEHLAAEYIGAYRALAQKLNLPDDLSASSLSALPEIFRLNEEQPGEDEVWAVLQGAVDEACTMLGQTREKEGENLRADLTTKLDGMLEKVGEIETRYPEIIREYEERIRAKVADLLADAQIDESRIAAEVVLFSDKLCTDEETVRLRSHIESMKQELSTGGKVGRKLDFIAQEMNREANTILSKANDLTTSGIAIDLKTEIEKIREQVQNIE